jgi:hypothetical protein
MSEGSFDPSATMISRVNKRMHTPIMQLSMLGAIVTTTITGSFFISDIKASVILVNASVQQARALDAANHLTAMESIQHEKDMRTIAGNNVNENVDEVKAEMKELKQQMKEDSNETQRLLRELIRGSKNE